MSEIPSNIAASGAQAGYQQAEATKARDAEKSGRAEAAKRGVKSIDDAGATIETGDEDVAVFADAEGAGGQGRATEEESNEDRSEEESETNSGGGIRTGNDGKTHLDIQA